MGFLSTKFSSGVFVQREGGECVVVGYQIPCYQIFGQEFPGAGGILDPPPQTRIGFPVLSPSPSLGM